MTNSSVNPPVRRGWLYRLQLASLLKASRPMRDVSSVRRTALSACKALMAKADEGDAPVITESALHPGFQPAPLARTVAWCSRQSPVWLTALSAATVVFVGTVDYVTGPELSFAIFYLAPVSFAAWVA